MIVIADTSPVNYLVQIGHVGILPALYGRVIIPCTVYEELQSEGAPGIVRAWIAGAPAWLEIESPRQPPDAALQQAGLDAGERDAILLAQELSADELILDDMEGRREAQRRHLHFIGTVGVLRIAAKRGLLDLRQAITRLQTTNFHIAQEIIERLLQEE